MINQFKREAENAVLELLRLVCRYAEDFHAADNSHTARDCQAELVKAVARELMLECDGAYQYELRHIPDWMAGIARPFRI